MADPGGGALGMCTPPLFTTSKFGVKNHLLIVKPYVFGIIGKLFENAGQWCLFYARIYSVHILNSN